MSIKLEMIFNQKRLHMNPNIYEDKKEDKEEIV